MIYLYVDETIIYSYGPSLYSAASTRLSSVVYFVLFFLLFFLVLLLLGLLSLFIIANANLFSIDPPGKKKENNIKMEKKEKRKEKKIE